FITSSLYILGRPGDQIGLVVFSPHFSNSCFEVIYDEKTDTTYLFYINKPYRGAGMVELKKADDEKAEGQD
ncbi:unnamed protein product, partial [marine sediment metagenome]